MKKLKFFWIILVFCAGLSANEFCKNKDLQEFLANINDGIMKNDGKQISLKSVVCDNGNLNFFFVANEASSKFKNKEYFDKIFDKFLTKFKKKYCKSLNDENLGFLHTNWILNLKAKDDTNQVIEEISKKDCE